MSEPGRLVRLESETLYPGVLRTMAPRANWKGFLRLSLVTCPVALYPATSESEKISVQFTLKLRPASGRLLAIGVRAAFKMGYDRQGPPAALGS
ncbi:hypothetical protein SAMN05443247_11618 [Bradyrhizobium erythrophlei]|nr:hypothetical protein SAMN05443247_11618 [Bradyrhizobium erythrophlei]